MGQRWRLWPVSVADYKPMLPAVGTTNLRPGNEDAFAQYLVDCVVRLKDEHNITVDYV